MTTQTSSDAARQPLPGHPPKSGLAPNASAILTRLRDTLFAVCDRHLSKAFHISTSCQSSLPPELYTLLSSLPDFKPPFYPLSVQGAATIGLWTALCDPHMLKLFGQAALDAASRARECVATAEGVIREQAEGGVSFKRTDLWACSLAFARTDSWGVWMDWKWWIGSMSDLAFAVSQHATTSDAAFLLFPLIFDFYFEDPLGLRKSEKHREIYVKGLLGFASGVCQVVAFKGLTGTEEEVHDDKHEAPPYKEMVQHAIDRLLSEPIATSHLSPTAIPSLRLNFAKMLVKLGDLNAAKEQLSLITSSTVEAQSVLDSVEQLKKAINDGKVDQATNLKDDFEAADGEASTMIMLDTKAATEFQLNAQKTTSTETQCGECSRRFRFCLSAR